MEENDILFVNIINYAFIFILFYLLNVVHVSWHVAKTKIVKN